MKEDYADQYEYYFQDGKLVVIKDIMTDTELTISLQLLNKIVKQAKALQKTRTV